MRKTVMVAAVVAGLAMSGAALAADVHIGINIGPPPIVVAQPPPLVVVPGTPVWYAPEVPENYFYYDGGYFTLHAGNWFRAPSYNGPWAFVPAPRVPRPLLAVPVRYYKVPPGHRRWHREWRDDDHGHGHGHDHDHGHGRGHGHGHRD